ncbi:hypothetical protein [Methylophaga sp.]|uniref:hypothetical protein n=1 Tax=Methylophaga sp. TaxID=2024840 RepID=UPI0027254B4F|nr:hypothetical protein [Methylophaga sp.]MDO8825282.1 hypothetical protein [Methylophaga sp.]
MKKILTTCLLGISFNVLALVSFPHTGNVTQHFNDSATIEIEGQAYLVNEHTVIHNDSNGAKRITVGTPVGYELDDTLNNNPLSTIKTIWLLELNE